MAGQTTPAPAHSVSYSQRPDISCCGLLPLQCRFLALACASPLQRHPGESEHLYPGAPDLHRLWRDKLVAHLQSPGGGIAVPLPGRRGTLSLLQRHAICRTRGRSNLLSPVVRTLYCSPAHLGHIRCHRSTVGWPHHVDSRRDLVYYHYEHPLHSLDAAARGKTACPGSPRI